MKTTNLYGMALVATTLLNAVPSRAADVEARLRFNGSVRNYPARQTVQGTFAGNGEFKPFGFDAKINGKVHTKSGQRPPRAKVYGKYPVQVYMRGEKWGASASDTFNTTAVLHRRYLRFPGYGSIRLNRPVHPNRPGRQILRGQGTFRYDY